MKARINDYAGHLRIVVSHENNEERMLLSAFLREHADTLLVEWMDVNSVSVTFGKVPPKEKP